MKSLRIILFAVAVMAAVPLPAQLLITQSAAPVAQFSTMKANGSFVSTTLLHLGSLSSFSFGSLTFNLIPNLDPNPPSDLQVGGGFSADVLFFSTDAADVDNFGAEQTLLGVGSSTLYAGYGPSSTLSTHITAVAPTDLIFWASDTSFSGASKFTMDDPLHFRTFAASDLNNQYYIFAIDDRGSQLVDYNDGVFGVALNLRPAAFDPVPEPSTYALVGAAFLCLIVAVRRIRNRSA